MKAFLHQVRTELTLFLRDRAVVTFVIVFPVLTVLFFGYLNQGGQVEGVSYASYLIAGGIGMVISSAAFETVGVALAQQREEGILKRLGATPLRIHAFIGAKIATATLIVLVQTGIMIALNVLLFGARITGNLLGATFILLFGALVFTTMGVALSGISRNTNVASAAARAISFPMQFLCGTLFPLAAMPSALRDLANALPLTYLVSLMRGVMLYADSPWSYTKEWIILVGCLLGAGTIAIVTFRWE
jgi:ABC-2 type transport system permease protein